MGKYANRLPNPTANGAGVEGGSEEEEEGGWVCRDTRIPCSLLCYSSF